MQEHPFVRNVSPIRWSDGHHPMQDADQVPAIFQEETEVPFTVALPSGDVDSAEQTIFMVPDIDDPRHKSDFANSPLLFIGGKFIARKLNRPAVFRTAASIITQTVLCLKVSTDEAFLRGILVMQAVCNPN
jgi:hypothetical protein